VFDAGPPCSSESDCRGGATCCSGNCVDTTRDPANCGQCGNDCGNSSFCTGTTCEAVAFGNLCDNTHGTVSLDPYAADNSAGTTIGAALTANCSPPTKIAQSAEDAIGVTDPSTGRPITGVGNTFIAGGGSYGQKGIGYMQTAGLLPLTIAANDTNIWFQTTATSQPIAMTTFGDLTAHHDYFCVEVGLEPVSGTLVLTGLGMMAPGTAAAGYWMSSQVIPQRQSFKDAWYIYEWTDTNGDAVPDSNDMYTLVAEGGPAGGQ
jgi:hypothetical protein